MGAMFYRGQPIPEIRAADYDDLKYFHGWHKVISRTFAEEAENAEKGTR